MIISEPGPNLSPTAASSTASSLRHVPGLIGMEIAASLSFILQDVLADESINQMMFSFKHILKDGTIQPFITAEVMTILIEAPLLLGVEFANDEKTRLGQVLDNVPKPDIKRIELRPVGFMLEDPDVLDLP